MDFAVDPATYIVPSSIASELPTKKEIRAHMLGYLACIGGLVADGLPSPRYVEYLADKAEADLPAYPTEETLIGENARLRSRIRELENG